MNIKLTNGKKTITRSKEQYEANKKPYDIKCENLGNVHIRILDTHDNTILIDYDKDMNIQDEQQMDTTPMDIVPTDVMSAARGGLMQNPYK